MFETLNISASFLQLFNLASLSTQFTLVQKGNIQGYFEIVLCKFKKGICLIDAQTPHDQFCNLPFQYFPFIIAKEVDGVYVLDGYCAEILNLLASHLNFT